MMDDSTTQSNQSNSKNSSVIKWVGNGEIGDVTSDSNNHDDDDDDKNNIHQLLLFFYFYYYQKYKLRLRKIIERPHTHVTAGYFVRLGLEDGHFIREYGMNVTSFLKLERLLCPNIEPKIYSNDKSIDSLTKVLVTLHYLRGGQYLDIMRKHNVGASTVSKCAKQVIEAICCNTDIGVPEWPNTVEKCQEYATEWACLSAPTANRGLFTTVIGMLDGLLINIESPKKMETKNQEDFCSGHKKQIGLNLQGLCDAKLKFLYVTMTTPGKTI
jgi:hypothetical protein